MFIFIYKVHWYVNHLQIWDMCAMCPTHNICNKCPTRLIRICNTCPTCTICTKSATCPTYPILTICTICPTCPICSIHSHMHKWAICIVQNKCMICIIRTLHNIVTYIPQVDEWCMYRYNCNIDVPSIGVKCMYSIL